MSRVLVVGESLIDVVRRPGRPSTELPGGSAANAAVALARLGVQASLATAVGDDARGRRLLLHLAAEGVQCVGEPVALESTAAALAEIDEDGTATYRFEIAWRLDPRTVSEGDAADADVLLVSSLAPVLPPGAAQVMELVGGRGGRSSIVYDVNARPAITGAGPELRAAVRSMAARADVVKASDEDLAALWPGLPTRDAAQRLLDAGAGAVVLTLGAAGSRWIEGHRVVAAAATPVEVVDTIGAGDTFGAALVRALTHQELLGPGRTLAQAPDDAIHQALAWAGRAAAVTVSRTGADPPTLAELGSGP